MATFRRVFRVFWWIICCLAFLALPLAIWDFTRKGYDIRYQAWFIGGIFAILSVPISTYGVAMHTEYYTRPRLQRHVIRILWMVPIYSIDAWFALRFRSAREYIDPLRECYEAYVIYNFFAYLMAYLEEELGDVEAHVARKPPMHHLPPFRWCFSSWPMGAPFLLQCKKGIMNYVILRPITTTIALITDIFGLYGQGRVDFGKSYVYLTATTNFSQLWALYCLGQLYWSVHKELAPIRPLSKFICIKSVVFLTFWQGTILAVLVSSGVIADNSWSSYDQIGVATGIQDFLICIEMFLAALAHAYAFPPKDQCELDGGFLHNVKHMFDLRDVAHDVRMIIQQHMGTVMSATKHAIVTLPRAGIVRTARGLGLLKKHTSGNDGKAKSRALHERPAGGDGQVYHPMQSSDDDEVHSEGGDQERLVSRRKDEEDEEQGLAKDVGGSTAALGVRGVAQPGPGPSKGVKAGWIVGRRDAGGAKGWEVPLSALRDHEQRVALLSDAHQPAQAAKLMDASRGWRAQGQGSTGAHESGQALSPVLSAHAAGIGPHRSAVQPSLPSGLLHPTAADLPSRMDARSLSSSHACGAPGGPLISPLDTAGASTEGGRQPCGHRGGDGSAQGGQDLLQGQIVQVGAQHQHRHQHRHQQQQQQQQQPEQPVPSPQAVQGQLSEQDT